MNNPIAKMYTDYGVITFELYPKYSPNTVNSFIFAAKESMYKNRIIKRVVKDFVLQPSYSAFEDKRCDFMLAGEFLSNGFDNNLKFEKYTLAMAGDGEKESHGCEFFITLSAEAGDKLQGKFAPFGKVIDGFDTVDKIANLPVKDMDIPGVSAIIKQPVNDVYMQNVTVETFGVDYPEPTVKYYVR